MANINETISDIQNIKNNIEKFNLYSLDEPETGVDTNGTNVVDQKTLRRIQRKTLEETASFLENTFGPMGSNTKIIKGENIENISSSYSKDGLKVLKSIKNSDPIEASIVDELIEITKHVEGEVGDGTTSTVILASRIFNNLLKIQNHYKVPPVKLIREFKKVVDDVKEYINSNGWECTFDDIYDIATISTNGDTDVATNIKYIYEKYGMDVDLSVGISNSEDNVVKSYDGLTITEGYADAAYVNNSENNTSEIYDAHIYRFLDPIDNKNQAALFNSIIDHNFIQPIIHGRDGLIPTVIVVPKMSRDIDATLQKINEFLYQFNISERPPILIISNVVASDELIMNDIATLCGCKSISKYIDPELLEEDQKNGTAPTVDNVWEFYGSAELVVADAKKTKFINPSKANDEVDGVSNYNILINYLETQIATVKDTGSDHDVGLLKKRLSALKANSVDYLVGGITTADKEATKDLVEDAIKNCKSAANTGVGYAANCEGLVASYNIYYKYIEDAKNISPDTDLINISIARAIFISYYEATVILYKTVESDLQKIDEYVANSIINAKPYNISNGELPSSVDNLGDNVKCTIMLDINVLDTISKIITIMVTSNQCLLQSPSLNKY